MKKKFVKTLDKILKCCIFALCLRFNRNNKSNKVVTTKNKKRNERNSK